MKMWEVFQALGILPGDRSGSKERMEATLADRAGRERLRVVIQNQQEHFDTFGLQLGDGRAGRRRPGDAHGCDAGA